MPHIQNSYQVMNVQLVYVMIHYRLLCVYTVLVKSYLQPGVAVYTDYYLQMLCLCDPFRVI